VGQHQEAPLVHGGQRLRRALLGLYDLAQGARLLEADRRPAGGLAVLVAPAGYGKTTLLAEWEAADPRRFAWLALNEEDNDPAHLITAIAGRLGIHIDLAQVDAMGRETPVLVDLKPSGRHYMEDLHRAGGLPTLLRELKPLLHLDALTVTGRTLGEEIDAAPVFKQDVVLPIRFLSRSDDLALFADVKEQDIQRLKPFVEPD